MNLVNWNDDRLDGFAANFQILSTKVDTVIASQISTGKDIEELKKDADHHFSTMQFRWMIIVTLFSNPITAGVVFLLSKGKSG